MSAIASLYDGHDDGGVVVRRPRVTDAIGAALQMSYVRQLVLPKDMVRLIDCLDRQYVRH